MPPSSSYRLYITFNEKAEVIRRAVVPLRSTYQVNIRTLINNERNVLTFGQEVLLDAVKTYGLPEDRLESYGLKYGRKLGETITWMELLPGSWSLVDDGDDLLLYSRQELGFQTTAMESFATLVPASDDTRGAVKDDRATKSFDQSTRPMVRYRYVKLIKGLEIVAHAASFLPDTYEVCLLRRH